MVECEGHRKFSTLRLPKLSRVACVRKSSCALWLIFAYLQLCVCVVRDYVFILECVALVRETIPGTTTCIDK